MRISTTCISALSTLILLLPGAGCAEHAAAEHARAQGSVELSRAETQSATSPATRGRSTSTTRYVLAISVDALNVKALEQLGRAGTPNFHRLMDHGATTRNARTEYERTTTLPNHTGMITGRRVNRNLGGHGVWFNDDSRHITVQQAAGHPVSSVFSVVHAHGRTTGLFASKTKFAMFNRSWSRAIDRFTVKLDNRELVTAVRRDLVGHPRGFTFLHLSLPDEVGHAKGFMSAAYLQAVKRTDRRLGELIHTINNHARLRDHLTVVLTADHGGGRGHHDHSDATSFANYRVPFFVWGAGVRPGARLYALNPRFAEPGYTRPTYAPARQPIRNGDVANLSTRLLGFGPVPGSEHDFDQALVAR